MLAHFVLVLQVDVKNIPNHNNHVPFGQLRDLAAHLNNHEYPMYLYTKIRRLFQCMYMFTCLLKILYLSIGQLWYMFFILDLLPIEKGHLNKASIDYKHVYVNCLFGTGWISGFDFKLKPGSKKPMPFKISMKKYC